MDNLHKPNQTRQKTGNNNLNDSNNRYNHEKKCPGISTGDKSYLRFDFTFIITKQAYRPANPKMK